jgi:hypothetical protein
MPMLPHLLSLKGWKILAQGNALGYERKRVQSPERALETASFKILTPFQGLPDIFARPYPGRCPGL